MYIHEFLRPQIGDILRVPGRLGIPHYGVYVGSHWSHGEDVLHSDKDSGVRLNHLWDFAGEYPIDVAVPARSGAEGEEIARRALSLRGLPYNLLSLNCEHLASYAQAGVPVSPTLRVAALLGVGGVLALTAWWNSQNR